MSHKLLLITVLAPALYCMNTQSAADEPSDTDETSEVSKVAKSFALECRIVTAENEKEALMLHPEPILRWTNPTAGRVYGDVHVWTNNGRPSAVASYYRWFTPDWGDTFEITSLVDGPITARRDGVQFWNTKTPGLRMQMVETADPPAKTPAARLIQMRRMANNFAAQLLDTRNNADGVDRELRLLNQPVYRYPAPGKRSPYKDGAMFAFVEGTDPEVLLLLESNGDESAPFWSFGLTRMNRDALRITYDGAEVWTAPFIDQWDGRFREPYAIYAIRTPLPSVP